jgi:high affinity sulfate transporter 1
MNVTPDDRGLRWPFPVFRSLDGYRWTWLPRDVTAGVLVVAIAIPLSMGMAEVAGMPPIAGLYSCVLPVIAYALFGSSRQLVIALDASTAAMVALAVAPIAGGDAIRYAALAGLVAVLVGLVLMLAGSLRLGIAANLLSRPVLLGYQAGLAMVVIVSQLPRLLGVTVRADDTLRRAIETVTGLGQTSLQTFVLGAMCLALVTVAAAWRLGAPAALVAVVGATFAVAIFPSTLGTVQVLGELPAGIPALHIPSVTSADVWALLPISAVIAFLAAADTIVSSRAFAQRNRYDVEANRDLIGLGAANVASGLSGGITTSASAARTAVVEMVGGRSQLASVAAAGVMVIVLLFLTGPLENVPTAALAAVVIGAVLRLIEVRSLRALWRIRRSEFLIALATAFGAVVFGLLEGIVIGVALTLVDFGVRRVRRRRYAPGLRDERKAGALAPAVGSPTVPVYGFTGALYFANARRFRDGALRLIESRPRARRLIVDATAIPDVDATAVQMLADLVDELERRGVALVLVGSAPSVRQVLSRAALDRICPDHVSDTWEEALPVRSIRVSERSGLSPS